MSNLERQRGFSAVIAEFLQKLRDDKLKNAEEGKRAEIERDFQLGNWLEGAAKRAGCLKAVTHTVKPMHPDAKSKGLFCGPGRLKPNRFVGSHVLDAGFSLDVESNVGNDRFLAVLEVHEFLNLEYEEASLRTWLESEDVDALAALSPDAQKSLALMRIFCKLFQNPSSAATHTLAKQVYWFIGGDPVNDKYFHLLAPLHPSSLIQAMHTSIQKDLPITDGRKLKKNKKE